MTVSGGIAAYPEDGIDLTEILLRADEALYRAKALGKNRISRDEAAGIEFPDSFASSRISEDDK